MRIAINGANRGIGLALVKAYLKDSDNRVIAMCRQASDELKALDNVSIVEDIDVTDPDLANKLESKIEKSSIDIFINNAGILKSDSWEDLNLEDISTQFQVNTLGPLNMLKTVLPYLAKNAKVGVLTSRMGSIEDNTSGGMYGYRISKAAANAAIHCAAVDLKSAGHPVAILHPGYVKTDMTGGQGNIDTTESASGLKVVMSQLGINNTGRFWHSDGSELPW